MGGAAAFSAAAVLVAAAFAGATYERWLARRRPHDLAWAASMTLFGAGALAYFCGVALGWRPWSFKAFYLLGGVLTVPVLALGTVYLLAGRRWGHRVALATALVGAFGSGIVVAAPLRRPLSADRLDAGREVLGTGPRILAAAGSGLGATVVIAGALWSAWRLLRRRSRPGRSGATGPPTAPGRPATPSRLAGANLLIAAGTLLISLKRPFEALAGSEETGFAVALSVGLAVMFVGFLLAAGPRGTQGTAPSAPADVDDDADADASSQPDDRSAARHREPPSVEPTDQRDRSNRSAGPPRPAATRSGGP